MEFFAGEIGPKKSQGCLRVYSHLRAIVYKIISVERQIYAD